MPTSYSPLLGLALPVTGELSGTWGDTVNDYITKYLDSSVAGTQTISGSQTAVTLSVTNGTTLVQVGSGATGSAQYQVINCTGNPASLLTVTVPAQSKTYVVVNATSTSQQVKIVGVGPTTGVTLDAGEKAVIAWNGSDFIKVATSTVDGVSTISFGTTGLTPSTATSGAVTVAGTLVAANGGTGQSTYTTGDLLYATGSTALSKLGIGTNGQILTSTGTAPQWSTLSGVAVTTFSAGTTGFTPSSATSGAVTLAGTLATTNGGTGLTSFTSGGAVYASSTSALTTGTLPIASGGTNATATPTAGAVAYGTGTAYAFTTAGTSNQVLISNGASAPSWSNLSSLGVTSLSFGTTGLTPSTATQGAITVAGTLATTNGGTGLTSFTANRVFYSSSTSAIGSSANLTFDGTTLTANALTTTSTVTINGGTANGVAYLNGSKVLTTGSALTFDGSYFTAASGTGAFFADVTQVSGNATKVNANGVGLEFRGGATPNITAYSRVGSAYLPITIDASNSIFSISGSEAMRLTSTSLYTASGINVGIGTSNPAYRLQVAGGYSVLGSFNTTSYAASSNTVGGASFSWNRSSGGAETNIVNLYDNATLSFEFAQKTGASTANRLYQLGSTLHTWFISGTDAMALTSTGLGIGTSLPSYKLNVVGANGGTTNLFQVGINAVTNGFSINTDASNNIVYSFLTKTGAAGIYQDASGNVGIGTSSPVNKFVVSNAGANGFEVNPTSGVSSGASLNGYNRSTAAFTPLTYTALAHYFQVGSSATTAATLDSSGNLGLGVTPSAWQSVVRAFDIGNSVAVYRGGSSEAGFGYNAFINSSGQYVYKLSTQASTYEQLAGQHKWFTAPSGTAGNAISFTQALTLNANGALVLQGGNTSASGVGVAFPATQVASSDPNTLDDYEEGTWTPTLTGSGGSIGSQAYTVQSGRYVKIGRLVTLTGYLTLSNKGSWTTDVRISNLPFTVNNQQGDYSATSFYNTSLSLPANNFGAGAYPVPNANYCTMFSQNNAGSSTLNDYANQINNTTQIGPWTIVYYTDA